MIMTMIVMTLSSLLTDGGYFIRQFDHLDQRYQTLSMKGILYLISLEYTISMSVVDGRYDRQGTVHLTDTTASCLDQLCDNLSHAFH